MEPRNKSLGNAIQSPTMVPSSHTHFPIVLMTKRNSSDPAFPHGGFAHGDDFTGADRELQDLLIGGRRTPQEASSAVPRADGKTSMPSGSDGNLLKNPSASRHTLGPKSPKRRMRRWCRVTLWGTSVTLAAAGLGGMLWFFLSLHEIQLQEKRDFAILTPHNFNVKDFECFLDKYPNSEHREEVKRRLDALRKMEAEWLLIESSHHVADFIRFKTTYPFPTCRYYVCCDHKIDSLDWIYASETGTEAAVHAYQTQHPDGAYALEATQWLRALQEERIRKEEAEAALLDSLLTETVCEDPPLPL